MDYRELLKKYIQLVGMIEGVTFINRAEIHDNKTGMTREEIDELASLDAEVLAEVKQGIR